MMDNFFYIKLGKIVKKKLSIEMKTNKKRALYHFDEIH